MKTILVITTLVFSVVGCKASGDITTSQITQYSDADENTAKLAMEKTCELYDRASGELLERAKDLNKALQKAIDDKAGSSEEVDRMLRVMKSQKPGELESLERECKQARATYGRIINVRADAAQRAADINYERAMRAPTGPTPISCVSTKTGTTVYTSCQ